MRWPKEGFLVDGMLGSLARKLRIYGFDVRYEANLRDEELLQMAKLEGRILVTGDRALYRRALNAKVRGILLEGEDEVGHFAIILRELGLRAPDPLPSISRCPKCNGKLVKVERRDVINELPKGVVERYGEFYRCTSCRKLYWEGSHWRQLEAFAKRVRERLKLLSPD